MTIDDYLDAVTRWPLDDYGGHRGGVDCVLFLANWIRETCGRDPAADLRGTYSTQAEARAILEKAGGFIPLVTCRLANIGWRGVSDPETGDVAIVSVRVGPGKHVQMPAIHRRGLWLFPDRRRLVAGRFHPLLIWRQA